MLFNSIASTIDQWALISMQRRVPPSLTMDHETAPGLTEVLAQTAIDTRRTDPYSVVAPGRRPVVVRSLGETFECEVRVQLSCDPQAPLIIYHHGMAEYPYDNSFRRIFRPPLPMAAHTVAIRAPFHANWGEPLRETFKTFERIYQTFAGSLRLIELVQQQFEAHGAPFTIVSGKSWGGITSMLYANLIGGVRAAAPLLSSPNLAQVILDGAERSKIALPISRETIEQRLNFTELCRVYDSRRVFPLLGQADQFFLLDKHALNFDSSPVVVDRTHVLTTDGDASLRRHIFQTLAWAGEHPFLHA